ncbi:Protein of unknown function [Ruaniaceae bacterium KH17]|nr:Protein of unknown function [Ruaniaceae bacterium KH17]
MNEQLALELNNSPAVSRKQNPALAGQIDRAVRDGELIPLLPGTYGLDRTFETLTRALFLWDPNAVLVQGSAARVSWWPDYSDDRVYAVTTRNTRANVPGIRLTRSLLHPDLIVVREDGRFQHPAASTLDLAREIGAGALDESLRRRATSLAALRWAHSLMPYRLGNQLIERYLKESKDEPWSYLERDAHGRLRRADITGWKSNYRVKLRSETAFLDIAFPGPKLNVELDGWEFHRERTSFIRDRQRDNLLRLAGWTVLRFTIETMSDIVPMVSTILAEIRTPERRRAA